jgi:peptidyl-dipeptidase A
MRPLVSRPVRGALAPALVLLALLPAAAQTGTPASPATAADAEAFAARAEAELLQLWIDRERASWLQSNFITEDTEALAALFDEKMIAGTMRLAAEATRFDGLALPPDVARKLRLIKLSIVTPAPADLALRKELTEITTSLESDYGKGKYCPPGKDSKACQDLEQLSATMAASRDPRALLEAWQGWRTVSPPMRERYRRFVTLANQGAKDLGYPDLGALWRAGYDMTPDEFAKEVDRLWGQVKPLYDGLHCYVRGKLQDRYGRQAVPDGEPIPAHLLGNMWAQSWLGLWDVVAPPPTGTRIDVTSLLRQGNVDALEMVRIGERFFQSLGLMKLPPSFWDRSLFVKPADRDVVCHASAWDVDFDQDVRLKMCIKIDDEDFVTVHHELGHNYYQLAYRKQPPLFRESANDGFHEAIGDTLALSITPEYLVNVGLLDQAPADAGDLDLLMRQALDKIAFLPFGLLVDQWRWKVFSGEITPENYNRSWWELVRRYQGVAPPVARSEAEFDPGAKYHVAANKPYTRYFLASVLQFQFQRALCQAAGVKGPLHRCSVYGSPVAGEKLWSTMEMGRSRPWQDALFAMTGQKQMDASAILDYFAPLMKWLEAQNKGRACGWK